MTKKTIHIAATIPAQMQSCKRSFMVVYPKSGSGLIELTPHGEYILTTRGVTEAAAKRMGEYKMAFSEVTHDMVNAYEAANKCYTAIHTSMAEVKPISFYKQELQDLTSKKYHKRAFSLIKPSQKDVEEDLRQEAMVINFNKADSTNHVTVKSFVVQHLNHATEERQQAWQEAKELYDRIEAAKEAKENAKYFAIYKTLYHQKEEFIQGKEDFVDKSLISLCANLCVPYPVTLSYQYDSSIGVVEADFVLQDGIHIQTTKANILSSGKISIKKKLVKEMTTDRTNSAVSLVYYLSSWIFQASPNIQFVRAALYERNRQNPLLWVQINRDQISKKNPSKINVLSDILGYPNVMNLKSNNDAIELCAMTASTFENEVKKACEQENIHFSSSASPNESDQDTITISLQEAALLMAVPNVAEDLRRAIAIARDKGTNSVIVNKKYKGLIDELKKKY